MELVRSRRNRRLGRMAVLAAGATLLVPIVTTGAAASGTPVFGGYQATSIGSSADAVAIGDVTGDGRQDVVMTSEYSGNDATDFRLLVFAQTPDGTLAAPVSYPTAASYTNRPDSVAVGDVTGDGRGDVVVAVAGLGIQLFPQVASGQLGDPTFYNTPDSNKLRIGKLDADGVLDVASIGWGTNTVSVFDGDGIGGLASPDVYAVQHGGFDDLEIADVTGDSRDDIVVMSGQTYAVPNVSVLAQTPGGTFTAAAEYSVAPNTNTSGIGVGDITGDGRTDVVAAYGGNRPASHLAVFAQTSTGMLAAPVSYASYDIPTPVEVADVDRDGHADVVTLHSGWARAGLYRGLASGGLDAEELYPLASFASYNPHGLAVGDITGDGWPDLAIASRDDGLVILRNNGSTPPPPPTPTPPPSPTATPTAPPSITPKPVSAPSAPTLLTANPQDGWISVSWVSGSDGGSPILSFTATANPGGFSCITASVSCQLEGLTNGTAYTVSVTASNAVGTSGASNTLVATPFQLPSAPRAVATSPNLASGVGLSWSAPASTGTGPLTGYRIYRGTDTSGQVAIATVGNVLSYTDTFVTNASTYYYTVAALNQYGESVRSSIAPARRGTAPTAPLGVAASAGGPGVTLTWNAPSSDGGSAVTAFRVYRGTASGGETLLVSVGSGTRSYLDKTVAHKTRYFYRVTATNVLGESVASAEVNVVSR